MFNWNKRREDISILQDPKMPMPWASINKEEIKKVQKVNSNISVKEFGRQSIKAWRDEFQEVFDKNFITEKIGKISFINTACSKPTKDQLIMMNVAEEVLEENYSWINLLQTICLLEN